MAATYFTLLTKIGQASIANAVALNKPVNLTYMAVGDGNGNPTTPSENQTALVREKYRAQINQLTVDPDNPNYLIAELVIPTTVGGWSIHEVGVFDDQSQLVAVANFPATYKPELAEGSGRDLIVRIVIQVSNTSVVTLKVDPAVILASQAWVATNYVKKITMAGGTTGQVLAKKSNANEDFKWVDPTAAVQVIVDSQTEEQTLASGQTIINLAKLTTQATAIYVEGVRLYPVTHYTINSDTRLTLKTSYPNGSKVLAVQNDPTSAIAMASLTEKGFTILSSTPSDDETKAATPKAVQSVSGGRLIAIKVFSTAGAFTYTPTPGAKNAKVIATGAGGSGARGSSTTSPPGGGGGAGGTAIKLVKLSQASYPVTVGAPASGGSAGGTSSFGSECSATGGGWASGGGGGAPGNGVGGDVNLLGGYGSDASDTTTGGYGSGDGGASYWGGGRKGSTGTGQTLVAAPGSGGGGNQAPDTAGQNKGAPGIVYIEEYS